MSSSASAEKPTSTNERHITTTSEPDKDDDWEIVTEKESQPSEETIKKEGDLERSPEEPKKEMTEEERKKELTKAKWAGMGQQTGGVHPHREVKIPSYGQFIGDW